MEDEPSDEVAMLQTLRIRNLVIVEDVTVEFDPGLNVLTGETGAGKSILVDALNLVAGARADRSAVRTGERRAVVEALFELDDGEARDWFVEQGLAESDEPQLVIHREVAATGSGRALINGSPCTLSQLREASGHLLELHGQHDQQSLLRPERHLELLDAFDASPARLERVRAAHAAVDQARRRHDELEAHAGNTEARLDELLRTVRAIESLSPRPGELEEIDRDRRRLQSAGRIAELLDEVVSLTYEGEPTASAMAATAARRAAELAAIDPALEELAQRARGAALELEDLGAGFRDYRQNADFDPSRLEELEQRRVELERLCLQHGTDEAGLLELRDRATLEIDELRNAGSDMQEAVRELEQRIADYAAQARRLRRARRGAAGRMARAVQEQLADLALPKARLELALEPAVGPRVCFEGEEIPLGRRGADRAELRLAANPGEPFRALHQVASGGELSRVMLALYVVVQSGTRGTLIFDEVDTGVSGAVADAVGARLAELGGARQVLCVTHLPQVAAYASSHVSVAKRVRSGRTAVRVFKLEAPDRAEELARMLGGRRATEASRRHAKELLASAAKQAGRATRRRA